MSPVWPTSAAMSSERHDRADTRPDASLTALTAPESTSRGCWPRRYVTLFKPQRRPDKQRSTPPIRPPTSGTVTEQGFHLPHSGHRPWFTSSKSNARICGGARSTTADATAKPWQTFTRPGCAHARDPSHGHAPPRPLGSRRRRAGFAGPQPARRRAARRQGEPELSPGEVVTVRTPGDGGWGPLE